MYFKFVEPYLSSIADKLLPLALEPTVGFGLSNNDLPFFPYLPPTLSIFSLPALEDLFQIYLFHSSRF